MGAQRIAEDEYTVTYQTDDGRIVRTGREQASMLGDDFGMTQPPSAMGNNAPEPQPSIATGAPDLAAMQRDPTAPDPAAAAPPIAPPAPQVHGSPPEPPAVTPAAPALGPEAVAPTSMSPSASASSPTMMPQRMPEVARSPLPTSLGGVAAAQDGNLSLQQDGIVAKARAEIAENDAKATVLEQHSADMAEMEATRNQQRAKEAAREQELTAKFDAAIDAADNHKIDRGNYWESRSTGQKVLAGIGVALAGLGMAMKGQGGKNPALDMIFKAIDDDVKDQMHRGEQLGKAVDRSRGLLATYGQIAETAEGRYNAMMAGGFKEAAAKIDAIAARSASPKVRANSVGLLAEVNAAALEHRQKYMTGERTHAMQVDAQEEHKRHARATEANARANTAVARQGLALRRDEMSWGQRMDVEKLAIQRAESEGRITASQAKAREADAGKKVYDLERVTGSAWVAPTEKAAEDINSTIEYTQNAMKLVGQMKASREKYGQELKSLNSEQRQQMESDHQALKFAIKDAEKLGQIQGGDAEMLNNLAGDDIAGFYDNTARLERTVENMVDKVNVKLGSRYGYKGPRWEPAKVEAAPSDPLAEEKKLNERAWDDNSTAGTTLTNLINPGVSSNDQSVAQERQMKAAERTGARALQGDVEAQRQIDALAGEDSPRGEWAKEIRDEVGKKFAAGELGEQAEELERLASKAADEISGPGYDETNLTALRKAAEQDNAIGERARKMLDNIRRGKPPVDEKTYAPGRTTPSPYYRSPE